MYISVGEIQQWVLFVLNPFNLKCSPSLEKRKTCFHSFQKVAAYFTQIWIIIHVLYIKLLPCCTKSFILKAQIFLCKRYNYVLKKWTVHLIIIHNKWVRLEILKEVILLQRKNEVVLLLATKVVFYMMNCCWASHKNLPVTSSQNNLQTLLQCRLF